MGAMAPFVFRECQIARFDSGAIASYTRLGMRRFDTIDEGRRLTKYETPKRTFFHSSRHPLCWKSPHPPFGHLLPKEKDARQISWCYRLTKPIDFNNREVRVKLRSEIRTRW